MGLCIIGVLVAAVTFTGVRFHEERDKAATPTVVGPAVTDGVVLRAIVLSLDPIRSEMTIRILPEPVGDYAGDVAFARPLKIATGTRTGLTEEEIEVGSPVTSHDVVASLIDSQVSNYPFDNYRAELALLMRTPDGDAVPAQVHVESAVHGYKIVAKPEVTRTDEFGGEATVLRTAFEVRRSGSTRFFAVFVMVLMWAIALGILWITLTVLFRRRPIEVPILSLFGIVLFALPNVRTVQSNAPPIGALSDILAFFWCESLVAACLVAMIIVFVRRAGESP